MSARSLNKVILIGNLTRDPELRYTPTGTAVCTFGLATNRSWTTQTGETKEETEFHRIVAWKKLAELCAQLLAKGRKTYVEGRLSTHSWTGQDGSQRTTTEVVIEDMIILDSKRPLREGTETVSTPTAAKTSIPEVDINDTGKAVEPEAALASEGAGEEKTKEKKKQGSNKKEEDGGKASAPAVSEDITPDDIPF